MDCKTCNYAHTHVVYTLTKPDGRIERRRECMKCAKRFTTWEKIKDKDTGVKVDTPK